MVNNPSRAVRYNFGRSCVRHRIKTTSFATAEDLHAPCFCRTYMPLNPPPTSTLYLPYPITPYLFFIGDHGQPPSLSPRGQPVWPRPCVVLRSIPRCREDAGEGAAMHGSCPDVAAEKTRGRWLAASPHGEPRCCWLLLVSAGCDDGDNPMRL